MGVQVRRGHQDKVRMRPTHGDRCEGFPRFSDIVLVTATAWAPCRRVALGRLPISEDRRWQHAPVITGRINPMRVYNFSAGPAMLPEPVLQRAKDELLDWDGSGMSVMVRALSVTSSPVKPSPRVTARTSSPSS